MEGDLYSNTNSFIYLRIDGVYYQRINGPGWRIIPEAEAPNLDKFWPLHEKQRESYIPALKAQGLLAE